MEDDYHKFVKYKLNNEILSLKVKRKIINNKVQKITIDSLSSRIYVGNENAKIFPANCKKCRTEPSTRLTQQNQSLQINAGDEVVPQDNLIASIQLVPVAFKMPDHSLKLKHLYSGLNKKNILDKRCWSALNLALLCISEEPCQIQFSNCSSSISLLSDSYNSKELALCHALLLCAMAKMSLSSNEIQQLEKSVICLVDSLITACNISGSRSIIDSSLDSLNSRNHASAYKLCKKLFVGTGLDLDTVNISTICCSSLKYLTDLKLNSEAGLKHIYGENTLKYVLGLTGKCTQEIVSSNSDTLPEDYGLINGTSHTINQCLQILEHTLSVDMNNSSLEHEDFSIHHCLTRLLGWSIISLFKETSAGKQSSNKEFHRSTLVSNLKVLSVLSFDPHQYDTFTNVKGLMEKIMICILKTYFESDEKYFDILVLCLELIINFYLKNKRTFVQLCLKTFKVDSNVEIRAVEALIKMLLNCVNKIKEVKNIALQSEKANTASNHEEPEIQLVLKAADKDMELSTIVSFISVLLVFFMDAKQSFKEFVQERIPSEMFPEIISVSKRFLQFASLTGGMPVTGIMILTHSIKRLEILNSSS